jgi:hypothetical protein
MLVRAGRVIRVTYVDVVSSYVYGLKPTVLYDHSFRRASFLPTN